MAKINVILCGVLLPLFLLGCGLFFAIKLRFFYLIKPLETIKSIVKNKGGFSSLCVALAGTLGIGNIVGVASAIIGGGVGSIFWMWISAFFAMGIKYVEVSLAMKHRRTKNGHYYGGASYYIYDNFKGRFGKNRAYILASFFAFLCAINSLTTGNLVQANAISSIFDLPKILYALIFTILAIIVVCRGIKRISTFTSVLIPILSAFYILLCIIIIISNLKVLPYAFKTIITEAFNIKSAFFGSLGFGITRAMRYGVSRGLLSNEAGSGTSPCAHASSSSENVHSQGCLGIFEVFFDTIILCTLTALVLIISKESISSNAMNYVTNAFESGLGAFGKYSALVCCLLFAFATVITQYFYGKESLGFITKSPIIMLIFTVIFFSITIISFFIPMSIMWEISDLALAIMTIFNLACILIIYQNKN